MARWLFIAKKTYLFMKYNYNTTQFTRPTAWIVYIKGMPWMGSCCLSFLHSPTAINWLYRGKVPACHRLWPPVWLKYSVHTSWSALLPSRRRHRPRAAWCPFSGPGCRGKRSGERHSPATETLVKTQKLRSEFPSDEHKPGLLYKTTYTLFLRVLYCYTHEYILN